MEIIDLNGGNIEGFKLPSEWQRWKDNWAPLQDTALQARRTEISEKTDGLKDDIVEVAFRSNGMRFINALAHLLPDDTLVIPLDNTAQGVHTIGDIKEQIKQTDPNAKYWRTVELKK